MELEKMQTFLEKLKTTFPKFLNKFRRGWKILNQPEYNSPIK